MSSTDEHTKTIEIFCSYSHKDQRFREQLEAHMSGLKRDGYVSIWHDRKIVAGEEWEDQIDNHLNTAQIILLLISADFLASDYCYDQEMKQALARHEAGEARVIPIILRKVDWKNAPFDKLNALPIDEKPITSWSDRDAAYLNVVQGIRKAVKELSNNSEEPPQAKSSIDDAPNRTLEQWLDEGQILLNQGNFDKARAAYEKAILLDPNDARAHHHKAYALRRLDRLYEAKSAYEEAIRLDSHNSDCYYGKGRVLEAMGSYEEALDALNQAIGLDPNVTAAYYWKGVSFYHLKRYEEALDAFEQSILSDSKDATAYNGKGLVLYRLERYKEALDALNQAIFLDSDYAVAYRNKSLALVGLGKLREAKQANNKAKQLEKLRNI